MVACDRHTENVNAVRERMGVAPERYVRVDTRRQKRRATRVGFDCAGRP
jgi:hypothetical protein